MFLEIFLTLALGTIVYLFLSRKKEETLPIEEEWWGKGQKPDSEEDTTVRPFKVETTEAELNDLFRRLDQARFTEPLENSFFQYGFNSVYLRKVVSYWRNQFNWKKQVEVLNKFPQFKTKIEGLDVHFVHVKPPSLPEGRSAKPLLMVHGWPGSIYEFYKIIPLLTDPASHGLSDEHIFEVICPSIPGYGFSEASHKKGCGLNDSPVGLAAYILEKFSTWTDPEFRKLDDGGLERKYSLDDLLTNVMLYWVPGCMVSAMRFYKENFGKGIGTQKHEKLPVQVPTGIASFPNEVLHTPRSWAQQKYINIISFNFMPRGGHFAAFEEPELLAADIQQFVGRVEKEELWREKGK
ncbi:epoxide hydrolase 1 isoform X2 [Caretta caretta]|uniref:epoxide hydrolase 1 isoform X2 n=1 Tax=Caretta caretta TaxID=8467 RepID=UPI002095F839|nr:epoxide hydrolase 1 isoform X2 [Caretta caretta]